MYADSTPKQKNICYPIYTANQLIILGGIIMIKKSGKKFAIAMITSLLISGITAPVYPANAAAKIKLNKKKVSMKVGNQITLKVIGTKKKVKWISSQKKVVKVSSKGKVTAIKAGSAKITAKVADKALVCKVTVVKTTTPNNTLPDVPTTPTIPTESPIPEPGITSAPQPIKTSTPIPEETLKPTEQPTAEPTKSPEKNTVETNLENLKKHIKKNGEITKEGDNQITIPLYKSNMIAGQCVLGYDKNNNDFSFITTKVYDTWSYSHGIFMNLDDNRINSIYLRKHFFPNTLIEKSSYSLMGSCDIDKLHNPMDLKYEVIDSKNCNVITLGLLADKVYCNSSFEYWDKYLRDNLSFSFKDIGFKHIELDE